MNRAHYHLAGAALWLRDWRGHAKRPDGQRVAEQMANGLGSWPFIIAQSGILVAWLVVNTLTAIAWDRPPFILLNLMLSFQAAFTGPILLIAANVSARRDRAQAVRVEQLAAHIERLASVDHAEHGRMLRELLAHTVCTGHTEIVSGSPADDSA